MVNKKLVEYFKRKIYKNINVSANQLLRDARKNGYKFSDKTARNYINTIKDLRKKGKKVRLEDLKKESKKTKYMRVEYIKIIEKTIGSKFNQEPITGPSYAIIPFIDGQDTKKIAILYAKKIENKLNKKRKNYFIRVKFRKIVAISDSRDELYKEMIGKK